MKIKTIVPAIGNPDTYINKPVTDRKTINILDKVNVIGVIEDVKRLGENFELTINLFKKVEFDMSGTRLNSIVIDSDSHNFIDWSEEYDFKYF